MFAGNIGVAQSVETIIYAANMTKDIENLYWHIVGDGSELENIKKLNSTLGLENVLFHGRQPLDSMPKYYAMADAMLVTMQKNDIISMTLPGKVQTYMAAGKPILGAIDGETAMTVAEAQCGVCCEAADHVRLANIVRDYVKNYTTQQYGACALDYYNKTFSKDVVFKKLIDSLNEVS